MIRRSVAMTAAICAGTILAAGPADAAPLTVTPAIVLRDCPAPESKEMMRCGVLNVPEDRGKPQGRTLPLRIVVLPARTPKTGAEPIFFLSGGPGQAATDGAGAFVNSWERQFNDVVLVDLRGTGEGHRLDCQMGGPDLQAYVAPLFSEGEQVRACKESLEKTADLRLYTTPIAMEDLDAARRALGYEKIHLFGVSYGVRAALTYVHRHGEHVRTLFLSGAAPLANRNPLYHAAAAQRAFDLVAAQCLAEPACKDAYGDIHGDLAAIRASLRAKPVDIQLPHPATGAPASIRLTESVFGDGLRVMLYSARSGREMPAMLKRARQGDFIPFAKAAVMAGYGSRMGLRLGLTLSVTCPEDIARIDPAEVARETASSFIGDARVRGQMAACAVWPKGEVPAWYFEPLTSTIPTVIVSGNLDPVTPPPWGEELRKTFTNSVHVITPGGHADGAEDCLASIGAALFASHSIVGLDTGCAAQERNPPFLAPPAAPAAG